MTLAVFAYVVMPGLALLVAGIGYAVIAMTDPARRSNPKAVGDLFDHIAS